MKNIYAVTRGTYSDYRIVALFTNKKLAEDFMSSFNLSSMDFNEIELYPINPYKEDIEAKRKAYQVTIGEDGVIDNVRIADSDYGFLEYYMFSYTHDRKYMYLSCFANNEEHAIKIANDKRIQIIAMNQWGNSMYKF